MSGGASALKNSCFALLAREESGAASVEYAVLISTVALVRAMACGSGCISTAPHPRDAMDKARSFRSPFATDGWFPSLQRKLNHLEV